MTMDSDYIATLISDGVPERQDLEYKRDLPEKGNEKARDEFLKDVTAMANGGGGTIIYGIGEEGPARAPVLHPIADPDFDAIERRLRQLLEMVEPRLAGVTFTPIAVSEPSPGYVIALQIQQTLLGPYWNEKQRRFHVRKGPLVTYQSYQEVRAAFERGADAQTRIAGWIAERVEAGHRELEAAAPTLAAMVCVIVPVASFTTLAAPFDIHVAHSNVDKLVPIGLGYNPRWNLDGFRVTGATRDRYAQVHRNGAIEVAAVVGGTGGNDRRDIPGGTLARMIKETVEVGCRFMATSSAPSPTVVSVSLGKLLGHGLHHRDPHTQWPDLAHTDRDHFPGMNHYLDDPTDSAAISGVVRGTCDVIWQGFGLERCNEFESAS